MATSETTRAVQRITGSVFLASVVVTAMYVTSLSLLLLISGEPQVGDRLATFWKSMSIANAGKGVLPFAVLIAVLGAIFIGRAFIRKNRFGDVPLTLGICAGFLGFFATMLLALFVPHGGDAVGDGWGNIVQVNCSTNCSVRDFAIGSGRTLTWLFLWFSLCVLALVEAKFDLLQYVRKFFPGG